MSSRYLSITVNVRPTTTGSRPSVMPGIDFVVFHRYTNESPLASMLRLSTILNVFSTPQGPTLFTGWRVRKNDLNSNTNSP
ncbi:hypothetical protein WN55_03529 [Dufourea novaeangliae]|uniref:Uncharacterized protein n=1 Tax=Dufourea novaeangliae TaxID=178035 RepID=A0A154PIL9_DUFNO|nr:hypothetical protein WN55_03529 [Dufourea novaeangliae]